MKQIIEEEREMERWREIEERDMMIEENGDTEEMIIGGGELIETEEGTERGGKI